MTVVVSSAVTVEKLSPFKAKQPDAQGHCKRLTLVGRNHQRGDHTGGVCSRTASLACRVICIWFYKRNRTLVCRYHHGIEPQEGLSIRQWGSPHDLPVVSRRYQTIFSLLPVFNDHG